MEQRYLQLKSECQGLLRQEHRSFVENLLEDECDDNTSIKVDTNAVLAQLTKLKINKASGPDDLSPRLLKETANTIAGILTQLFQKSLDLAIIPDDWRKANVTPVYKKGDKYDPSNYRPISLTCITSKILEHIVTSQMMGYLERNNKLDSKQHGFRSKRSCETQLLELTTEVSRHLDQREEVDALILDFSKAFDKVTHSKMITKLADIGVNRQVTNWIEDFLRNRTQVVVVDGFHSSPCGVTSGVPQGSVIGPALFRVYINDLPDSIRSKVRLFADDTVIYSTTDKADELQKDLAALEKWEKEWDMKFNPTKCEHIKFSRKRKKTIDNTYVLHGIIIPQVNSTKYLGVKLEKDLRWNTNTNFISAKAASRLGFVSRTIPFTLPHLREKAYKQLVRPVLEYASTVWDPTLTTTQSNALEAIQRKAARLVNNISRTDRTTSTTELLCKMNWEKLSSRRESRSLGLFRAMHFNEIATTITDYISPLSATSGFSRRHEMQYHIPHCHSLHHQNNFFIKTAKAWNQLPVSSNLLVAPPVAG